MKLRIWNWIAGTSALALVCSMPQAAGTGAPDTPAVGVMGWGGGASSRSRLAHCHDARISSALRPVELSPGLSGLPARRTS